MPITKLQLMCAYWLLSGLAYSRHAISCHKVMKLKAGVQCKFCLPKNTPQKQDILIIDPNTLKA
jgi:hypothetical protein